MNRQRAPPRPHAAVPKTWAVTPGAAVNIVLKADQPTGRTVAGTVQDVLTRGNHPRGIKVRLADGRVGRVQSMASSSSTTAPSSSAGDPGGVVEGMRAADLVGPAGNGDAGPRQPGQQQAQHPVSGSGALPAQQVGLEAFIKEAAPKPRRKGAAKAQGKGGRAATAAAAGAEGPRSPEPPSPAAAAPLAPAHTATCPVCGAFEGDEAAVSHHVASHFDTAS